MLPLIQTLFDISLLRKGPENIPRSWLLLYAVILLRTTALFAGVALVESFTMEGLQADLIVWFVGLACFSMAVLVAGKALRLLQTLTALIGIGAIVTFIMIAIIVFGRPFLGESIANGAAQLLLLWSVVIKGHIIARAIGWHWYAGLVVSIAVLLVQLSVPTGSAPAT